MVHAVTFYGAFCSRGLTGCALLTAFQPLDNSNSINPLNAAHTKRSQDKTAVFIHAPVDPTAVTRAARGAGIDPERS